MSDLETDYLIVGAGAVGLAFADTLLDENPECHITIVDRHAKPGGHWNDSYGFVALHQPSATYGVNSLGFETEHIDTHGPNKGLFALASGTEVLAYFEKVVDLKLLPSGRVDYRPLTEFKERGEDGKALLEGIVSGEEKTVAIRRKLVDATFYQTSVPATHTPSFEVEPGVDFVPPGELVDLWKARGDLPPHYVILGGGKTAMDTAIWLLEAGASPADITWVRPRESWLWNRDYTQPGEDFIEAALAMQTAILRAASQAKDGAEMMRILGEDGYYLRIDENIEPEMFHYATISRGEVEIMRRITQVIRGKRVKRISPPARLELSDGSEQDFSAGTLFVDCTASAVPFEARKQSGPQFRGDTIVLQPLHVPLVTFSAALTAFLEANFDDDDTKNALGTAGPLTDTPATFPYAQMVNMMNRGAWSQQPEIMAWLARSRLDLATGTIAKLAEQNSPKLASLQEMRGAAQECMPDLVRLGMEAKAIHESA